MEITPKQLYNQNMTVNGSTSINLSSSFKSDPRNLQSTPAYSIQFIWSGANSPTGTFSLEASNDNVNYVTIGETALSVSGNSGDFMINVERPAYLYVRVSYSSTGGSGGTVTIIINGVN